MIGRSMKPISSNRRLLLAPAQLAGEQRTRHLASSCTTAAVILESFHMENMRNFLEHTVYTFCRFNSAFQIKEVQRAMLMLELTAPCCHIVTAALGVLIWFWSPCISCTVTSCV